MQKTLVGIPEILFDLTQKMQLKKGDDQPHQHEKSNKMVRHHRFNMRR